MRPKALTAPLAAASLAALLAAAPAASGAAAAEPGSAPSASALRAQVLLARAGFSPGLIDGRWGTNTRSALRAYRRARGLGTDAEWTRQTRRALESEVGRRVLARYTIREEDVAGPFVRTIPDDLMAQSKLERLAYRSPGEKIAERLHADPDLLRRLNEGAKLRPGLRLRVPAAAVVGRGARRRSGEAADPGELTVRVSKSATDLTVVGREGEVVFYAPVTAGSAADPLPLGDWKVTAIGRDPTFHYDPSLFHDAPAGHEKAAIPPGPNNPVGVVWIDLDKEHYGIHGTPEPSEIGYETSHGCVRLTNWDALRLAELVAPGTRVLFRE